MPRKPNRNRLYTRERGAAVRYYADLRDLGGGRIALIPEGETLATTDPVIAAALLGREIERLQERKRTAVLTGIKNPRTLAELVELHLVKKAKAGRVTEAWLDLNESGLRRAIEYFGAKRDVASISVADVQAYAEHLAELPNGRGAKLSPGSVRSTSRCSATCTAARRARAPCRPATTPSPR